MSLREDGSWPREDEQPERRLEEVVGKGTEAGKGALTLPSVRPGVGLPPTSSSSVPPRVCHHRHRPSVRLSLRTPTIRPVTLVSHMSRFFAAPTPLCPLYSARMGVASWGQCLCGRPLLHPFFPRSPARKIGRNFSQIRGGCSFGVQGAVSPAGGNTVFVLSNAGVKVCRRAADEFDETKFWLYGMVFSRS